MAERFTKKLNGKYVIEFSNENEIGTAINFDGSVNISWNFGKPIDKLGKLEDVLEKYGIESVEELDTMLNGTYQNIENAKEWLSKIYLQDRDTWKKACELACEELWERNETICDYSDPNYICNYFYQQAKEGKDVL